MKTTTPLLSQPNALAITTFPHPSGCHRCFYHSRCGTASSNRLYCCGWSIVSAVYPLLKRSPSRTICRLLNRCLLLKQPSLLDLPLPLLLDLPSSLPSPKPCRVDPTCCFWDIYHCRFCTLYWTTTRQVISNRLLKLPLNCLPNRPPNPLPLPYRSVYRYRSAVWRVPLTKRLPLPIRLPLSSCFLLADPFIVYHPPHPGPFRLPIRLVTLLLLLVCVFFVLKGGGV